MPYTNVGHLQFTDGETVMHLTDMEELLATIPGVDIRDYMREAMSCYMASAYRGAVVLSYIALFDDLLAKLGELANVNSTAKTIYTEANKKKEDQDVYESYLIDQLTSNSLISGLDSSFLTTLRKLRNKSAHPSGHKPSAEEARFIFFETIDRFLSKAILSTTHLVDEIVVRLKNTNFFPSTGIGDVCNVVGDELVNLHDAAMPQLVAKMVVAATSSDATTSKNSIHFLVGLAKLNNTLANDALQSKLIASKADDAAYEDILIQVISANGKLVSKLTVTTVERIRATLTAKISKITSALSENNLNHPTAALVSIATALPEEEFVEKFRLELDALFEKRAHSELVIKLVSENKSLLTAYLPVLFAKAGSNDFITANAFSNAVEALDSPLNNLLSDCLAFQLVISIMTAARGGAWSAKAIVNAKFAGIPLLRAKARSYIEANDKSATAYICDKFSEPGKPMEDFVAVNLTDEVEA